MLHGTCGSGETKAWRFQFHFVAGGPGLPSRGGLVVGLRPGGRRRTVQRRPGNGCPPSYSSSVHHPYSPADHPGLRRSGHTLVAVDTGVVLQPHRITRDGGLRDVAIP